MRRSSRNRIRIELKTDGTVIVTIEPPPVSHREVWVETLSQSRQ